MRGGAVESRRDRYLDIQMLNVAAIALKVFLFGSKSRGAVWGEELCGGRREGGVAGGRKAADHTALTLNRYDGGFY